jgi:hypothetical protein
VPLRKVHGHIPGIPVGTFFLDRKQLSEAGVHGRPMWGIHGTEAGGAYAIALNGGYEDDLDRGETVYVCFSPFFRSFVLIFFVESIRDKVSF